MTGKNRQTLHDALEAELAPVRLSEARRAAILAAAGGAGARRRDRRPWRVCLTAAALCAALAVTAVAASPSLREALAHMLGGFEPYAQEVEGVAATDQGIRLRVVRALADENGGTVYLEAEDLTGDRLSGESVLGGNSCLAYDSQSRTALFAETFRAVEMDLGLVDGEKTMNLEYSWLLPAVKNVGQTPLPWKLVTGERLDTLTLAAEDCQWGSSAPRAENTVLAPEQTPAELDTGLLSLSSMGFDDTGSFHIQLHLADGVNPNWYGGLYTTCPEIVWDLEQIPELHTVFTQDGVTYYDICFVELTAERFGQFRIRDLLGTVVVGEPIEGSWTLSFPLELLPSRTVALEEELNGQIVEQLTISATSVKKQARFADQAHKTVLGYPLTVYLTDGSMVTAPYEDSGRTWTRTGESIVWPLPWAIDPAEVVGIAIGQWYLPINPDDTAGPGHWLEELPAQEPPSD